MAVFRTKKARQFVDQVADLNSTKTFEYVKLQEWDKVIRRLNKSNRVHEVRVWVMLTADDGVSKSNLLPIHLACWRSAPLSVFRALVEAHPKSLEARDQFGRVPLHIAIVERCEVAVVTLLIRTFPSAANEVDQNGELPLHLVMLNCSSISSSGSENEALLKNQLEIITQLVDAYPQGIYETNMDGLTPFHMAKLNNENSGRGANDPILALMTEAADKVSKEVIGSPGAVSKISSSGDAVDDLLSAARQETEEKKRAYKKYAHEKRVAEAEGKMAYVHHPHLSEKQIANEHGSSELKAVASKIDDEEISQVKNSVKKNIEPSYNPINENRLFKFIARKDWVGATQWIESHPDEANHVYEYKNGLQRYPLLEVIVRGPSVDCVKAFVRHGFRGVITCDKNGALPLHVAIRNRVSPDVISVLIANEYKATSEKADNSNNLPLHYAYEIDYMDAVYLLLAAYPEAAFIQNRDGLVPSQMNPKHAESASDIVPSWRAENKTKSWIQTFLSQENWDGVIAFCSNNQSGAFEWSVTTEVSSLTGREELHRYLPIHLALTKASVPIKVIKKLIECNKNALFCPNQDGLLPIHIAAKHGVSLEIISELIHGNERSTSIKDYAGNLPIDLALENGNDLVAIELSRFSFSSESDDEDIDEDRKVKEKIKNNGGGMKVGFDSVLIQGDKRKKKEGSEEENKKKSKKKKKGNEFVQAIQSQNWSKALKCLRLDANMIKEEVSTKIGRMKWKRSTLHEVVRMDPPTALVREMIRVYPEALKVKETLNDRLPLHLACETGNVDIIQILLDSDIDSSKSVDSEGCLSIHLATLAGCSSDVFYMLLAANPDGINVLNNEGMTPSQISKSLQFSNQTEIDKILQSAKLDYERKYKNLQMPMEDMRVALTASLRHIAAENDAEEIIHEISYLKIIEGETELVTFMLSRDWSSVATILGRDDDLSFEQSITWMKIEHNFAFEKFSNSLLLPVHFACLLQAPFEVIDLLISQVQMVIPPSEPEDDTLAHMVAMYSPGLFKYLHLDVGSVLLQNSFGKTTLHSACDTRSWGPMKDEIDVEPDASVVKTILSINESLAAIPDNNGDLPLHTLMGNCRSTVLPKLEIIYILLKAYPASAKVRNASGETPLNVFHKNEHKFTLHPAIDERRKITEALLRDENFWKVDGRHNEHDNSSFVAKTNSILCTESISAMKLRETPQSDSNVAKFGSNSLQDCVFVHFNSEQKTQFDLRMKSEIDLSYKSEMMKQEVRYARAHQMKRREERLAEEERLAKIMDDEVRAESATAIQRIWRGHKAFKDMYIAYLGLLRLQAQWRSISTRSSFVKIRNGVIKCQASVRMVHASKKYRQNLRRITREKEAEEQRLAQLAREKEAEEQRLAQLAREKEAEELRLAQLAREKEAEELRLAQLAREKEAEELRLAQLAREKEAEEQRLAQLAREKEAEEQRLAQLAREKEAEEQRLAQLAREKEVEERHLAEIAKENQSATHIQRIWRGHKAFTRMLVAYRGLLRLQAQTKRNSARLLYREKVISAVLIQKNIRRYFVRQYYVRIRDIIIGMQLSFRERQAERKVQYLTRRNDDRLKGALEKERNLRDNYRKIRINNSRKLKNTRKSIPERFSLNQIDFRSLLKTNVFDDSEDEDDILGIFAFQEKENATVLFSTLNSLIASEKWSRAIKRISDTPGECSLWIVQNDGGRVWKRLPLHAIMKRNPTIEVVAALISAYPESLQYKDNLGALPIHYASEFGATLEVIQELVSNFPRSIIVKDREGKRPIDRFNATIYDDVYSNAVMDLLKHEADALTSYRQSRRSLISSQRSSNGFNVVA